MIACEVGFVHDCERQYTIAVKNCSSFLVSKLKPLDVCSAAYCFGKSDISHFLIVFFHLVKLSETNYTLILKVIYAYTLVFLISEPSNECKLKMKCVGLLKQKQI